MGHVCRGPHVSRDRTDRRLFSPLSNVPKETLPFPYRCASLAVVRSAPDASRGSPEAKKSTFPALSISGIDTTDRFSGAPNKATVSSVYALRRSSGPARWAHPGELTPGQASAMSRSNALHADLDPAKEPFDAGLQRSRCCLMSPPPLAPAATITTGCIACEGLRAAPVVQR